VLGLEQQLLRPGLGLGLEQGLAQVLAL